MTLDLKHYWGPVREGDRAMLDVVFYDGFEGILLSRLNPCLKFKCVVHLSNLVLADGRTLQADVFDRSPGSSCHYRFLLKYPTWSDFALCEHALRTAGVPGGNLPSPGLRLPAHLDGYVAEPHQQVEWFQSKDAETIYFYPSNKLEDSHDVFCMCIDVIATHTRL